MSEERYRVMAVDYGTKRIGIAVSDELRMLASARGIIQSGPNAIAQILAAASRDGVRTILIGIPRTLSNTDSDMTRQVRQFAAKLRDQASAMGIDVVDRDERLTSVMANDYIAQSGLSKRRREEKSLRDEEAARIVLQEYLDQQRPSRA
jgi:putative Holliday junction resolvase